MIARLRRSIGLRLLLLFAALAVALSLFVVGGMQRALSAGWNAVLQPLVADYVDRLAAEIGSPPDPARAAALVQRLPISIRIEGPQVQFDSAPGRTAWQRRHGRDREIDHEIDSDSDHDSDDGWWLLTRSTADGHRISFGLGEGTWRQRPRAIGWATLLVLLALTGAAYLYVRRLFRPLDDIRAGALRYGSGDFATPIPQRRHDELGELAGQINTMAAELQRMLDAKRGLLLAISHELRSPLTRARLNAELLADSGERDALLRDLAEMRDLVTDLLESERLAAGHTALQRESSDLNALAQEAASGRAVQLDLDSSLPPLPLDRTRVRLALRNLLDNAQRHGAGDRAPVLATRRDGAAAVLSVRDFGPGVADEHLAQLASAFWRPDAARSRAAGGVGLGLYLCRLVAQAHGGSLAFANAQPGLRVELRLPIG